jgi:class 3 adenylate cyclase
MLSRRRGQDPRRVGLNSGEVVVRAIGAHCHLGLGKLYRRMDKRSEAQERLTTAATMYRAMDMRFWLDQADAELAELR